MKINMNKIISSEGISKAIEICNENISSNPPNLMWWRTQLGYLYFMNEMESIEDYYINAPRTFTDLVRDYPEDVNSRFWLGYIHIIALHDTKAGVKLLKEVVELDPTHAYANLILSEYARFKKMIYLQNVVQQQSRNFRALWQLSLLYKKRRRIAKVKMLLEVIISSSIYVESNYDIINSFINDVFILVHREKEFKERAKYQLQQMR